jgi:nucleotide-binding universal stress UspA family protein
MAVDPIATPAEATAPPSGPLRTRSRGGLRGARPTARLRRSASARALRVVCAVAATDESRAALEFASSLAERWDAELIVVTVAPSDRSETGGPFVLDSRRYRENRAAARERARRLLEREAGSVLKQRARGRVEIGEAAAELATIAAEESAALLVVGEAKRGSWLRRWYFARRLVRRCPCPVLFIRPDASPLVG